MNNPPIAEKSPNFAKYLIPPPKKKDSGRLLVFLPPQVLLLIAWNSKYVLPKDAVFDDKIKSKCVQDYSFFFKVRVIKDFNFTLILAKRNVSNVLYIVLRLITLHI